MITSEWLTSKVLTFTTVPSASSAFTFWLTLLVGFGKNLPQSTKGAKVMTVPAAAINFRKSRRDTFPPSTGGVRAMPRENDSLIINKPLEIELYIYEKENVAHLCMSRLLPEVMLH